MLATDLEENGDTENISLGVSVTWTDGMKYRLDAVVTASNDISIVRDSNFINGMVCVVSYYKGANAVFVV